MTTVTVVEHKPSFWQRTKQKVRNYAIATATAFGVATTAITTVVMPNVAYAALDVAPLVAEIKSNEASVQTAMLGVLGLIVFLVAYNLVRRILR